MPKSAQTVGGVRRKTRKNPKAKDSETSSNPDSNSLEFIHRVGEACTQMARRVALSTTEQQNKMHQLMDKNLLCENLDQLELDKAIEVVKTVGILHRMFKNI